MKFFWWLLCCVPLFCVEIDPAIHFYKEIKDIKNPTYQELQTLQHKLLTTPRPILNRMKDTAFIPREFRFLHKNSRVKPIYEKVFVKTDASNKEQCIILYSSYNERYPRGVKRLAKTIVRSDYKGHLHYRIGGWPNIQAGDLKLAHVPFAFKACYFKEMLAQGYKKVLWLDASILPAPGVSLNTIFQMIKQRGIFVQAGDHPIDIFMNEDSAKAFGMTMSQIQGINSCSAAIIGMDLENPRVLALLEEWYEKAHHPFAFFSARSDQNALTILIEQHKFTNVLIPRNLLGSVEHPSNSLFIMDRRFVKNERN